MAKFQRGVLAEANLHSLYLLFKLQAGFEDKIRKILAEFQLTIEKFSQDFSESELTAFAAIGSEYWFTLYGSHKPEQLTDFPNFKSGNHIAPVTPYDLFIQIRSDRVDVNHLVGTHLCLLFGDSVHLQEQVKGFRYLDGRDFTGFIEGGDNPHGVKRQQVALVSEYQDPDFAGGSYIHIQRYRHLLSSWNELSLAEQEKIIGRSKTNNQLLADQEPSSHYKTTHLFDEYNQPIEYLNQSMPYGTMKMQGLFAIACCHTPIAFEQILASRLGVESEYFDRLLNYTRAETGAAFFAPSVDFLKYSA
ncbi:Dyp-type peroxidase [Catenovulum sp. 2E275]|uniref:Dyp-type peroxidase n=1 Tax=Catenovulum sp. 2E275 TaxID=2980497 RepID=UPI0021CE5E04|nr:Dyp-type peroxidase [Catenovulum sp. 2E275]MCU4677592.1 Dyp-type peroxidase [Catenovulum sp. 2E275]